jgi:hypothetical protein
VNRSKSVLMERVGFFVTLVFVALYAVAAQATTESTTISPGSVTSGSQLYEGLWTNPYGMGSASPSATSGGKTYNTVVDAYQWLIDEFGQPYLAYSQSWIAIGGFTSDPGASWLTSAASMSTAGQGYMYQSAYGIAVWGVPGAFGIWEGTSYPLTIVHQ